MSQRNFVAKNLHKTSRAVTHVDRRNRDKAGYQKHKGNYADRSA
jgi:hypothetical protein